MDLGLVCSLPLISFICAVSFCAYFSKLFGILGQVPFQDGCFRQLCWKFRRLVKWVHALNVTWNHMVWDSVIVLRTLLIKDQWIYFLECIEISCMSASRYPHSWTGGQAVRHIFSSATASSPGSHDSCYFLATPHAVFDSKYSQVYSQVLFWLQDGRVLWCLESITKLQPGIVTTVLVVFFL